MDWYPRDHVRKRGRPPTDWDKEMKKTCGGTAWKRVALERKEWKRMGQLPHNPEHRTGRHGRVTVHQLQPKNKDPRQGVTSVRRMFDERNTVRPL
ncbi:unnamed protein product [Nezara viridula]|uniref:Uncharacterized protein n=1 Tax=Nezara viridula TaxID=85310 RepID=A0A9P0HQQ8_NEZVI|nr:unnamed protein product [Nezara viridula]